MNFRRLILVTLAIALPASSALAKHSGKEVYNKTCTVCHASGLAGAPKFGSAADWGPRLATGTARLYGSALKGTPKGMPAKGGDPSYTDAEVKAAVDFMVAAAKNGAKQAAQPAAATQALSTAKVESISPSVVQKAEQGLPKVAAADTAPTGDVNAFNRLLKPVGKRNPAPMEDGVHDPSNDGTRVLMTPKSAFATLPKDVAGNRVNWVQALESGNIKPRWDRNDPAAEPGVMDLNIEIQVKGHMPDVVYPHKQHTEWLECSNCHPDIFIPQKGANNISMAAILLGQKCGICHGKVAFPVSECRRCHSKKKDETPQTASRNP